MLTLNWNYHDDYEKRGFNIICGVDEAGRGPLAGPVYAAACILPRDFYIEGLYDSKILSEKKRNEFFEIIKTNALGYSISSASIEEIDSKNILNASMLAMRRALQSLVINPDIVLVDGNIIREMNEWNTEAIIKGDTKIPSIAAASILAKVSRDNECKKIDLEYPEYGFAHNKGYGTKEHMNAIRKYGICSYHRKSFMKFLYK